MYSPGNQNTHVFFKCLHPELQRYRTVGVCQSATAMQVSLVLPTVQDTFGAGATYLGFAVIGVAAVATIYAIVPETKGKSLEEIEALFDLESDEKSV